jgi:hypothetical protein
MRKPISAILYLVDFFYLGIALGFSLCLFGWLCTLGVSKTAFAQAMTNNEYFFLDFGKYYTFAKMTFSADRFAIFDPSLQWKWQQFIEAPAVLRFPAWSEYPPFLGIFFAPLTLVPLGWAYLIWIFLSAGSACGCVYWLARKFGGQSRLSAAGCAIGMLASVNALWATLLGQLNWFMVTCIAILYIGLLWRKQIAAGVGLALMSLKPQYAVFYAATCLNKWSWKAIAVFAIAECLLAVASGLCVGWSNVFGYPQIVLQAHAQLKLGNTELWNHQDAQESYISIRRLSNLLLGDMPLSVALLIMLAAMAGIVWLWTSLKNEKQRPWAMAATILTFLLVNPQSHMHDCVSIGAAAALTMPTVSLRGMQSITDRVHRIWCHVLYFYPIIAWIGFLGLIGQSVFRTLFFLLANLLLLVLALAMFRRQSRPLP